jgi:hypothetical protein
MKFFLTFNNFFKDFKDYLNKIKFKVDIFYNKIYLFSMHNWFSNASKSYENLSNFALEVLLIYILTRGFTPFGARNGRP